MQQSIQDFSAGLRTDLHQSKIPDGACAACQNTLFTKGTVKVRPGFVSHSAAPDETPDLAAGITALAQYVPPDGLGQNMRLVAQFGSLLKATDNAAQTFAAHLDMATTLATTAKVRMQQFGNSLYLVDGVNNAKKMFNLGYWERTATIPLDPFGAPFTTGNLSKAGIVLTTDYYLVSGGYTGAGNPGVHRFLRSTGAFDVTFNPAQLTNRSIRTIPTEGVSIWVLCRVDAASGAPDTALVLLNWNGTYNSSIAGSVYGAGATQLSTPMDFCLIGTNLYVADTGNGRVSVWTTAGAHSTNYSDATYTTSPVSICTDGTTYFYVADSATGAITKWDTSGNRHAVFGQDRLVDLVPTDIRLMADGTTLVVLTTNGKQLVYYSTSGVFLGATGRAVEDTTYGMGVGTGTKIYVSTQDAAVPSFYVIALFDRTASAETQVTQVTNETATTNSPFLAYGVTAGDVFTAGDYSFKVVIARSYGYEVVEGDAGPLKLVTVPGGKNYIDVTWVSTTTYDANLWAHLYCLAPGSTEWILVATRNLAYDAAPITWRVLPDHLVGRTTLEEFVPAPYAACSHLIEWQGRMVYVNRYVGTATTASKDTLHISNLSDADRVATGTYVDPPDTFGTYVQVGNDGTPITGLAKIGSYLAVFKRQSVWLLSGSSWRDFELAQVSSEHGCVSHESIAYVSGRLVFLANDSVWSFDGQQFDDLGKNIRPTIDGYTLTQKEKSFAVYDPNNRWYVLFMPSTAALASVPTGHVLVFDLRTGAWSRFTVMPGNTNGAAGPGCAIYASRKNAADATTAFPGVFAGDPYGTVEANIKLFRLFTGTTDLGANIAWDWYSKEFSEPGQGRYKDVKRVRAHIAQGAAATNTFTGSLRVNGNSSDDASKLLALPAGSSVPMIAEWSPALLPDAATWQYGMSGSSSTALEVSAIDVTVSQKGEVK